MAWTFYGLVVSQFREVISCVGYWLQIVFAENPVIVLRLDWQGAWYFEMENRDVIQQLPHQVYLKGTGHNG